MPLHKSIRAAIQAHYPNAQFAGKYFKLERAPETQYIDPCFCFEKHTRKTVDEHLEESLDLVLSDDNGHEFYRETITFDPIHFVNLINSTKTTYRDKKLIELGKDFFTR